MPEPGEWHPRMPAHLDEEELAEARRPQRGLSARRPHPWGASRGSRRLRPGKENPGGRKAGVFKPGRRHGWRAYVGHLRTAGHKKAAQAATRVINCAFRV